MLLLNIPLDFDPVVLTEYGGFMPVLMPGWHRPQNEAVTVYVCSPPTGAVDDEVLDLFPKLHTVATASTGTNHIDLAACARRGIKVISLLDDRVGLKTISASAEWTFKLILEGLRLKKPYHELAGRRVGLVGYGRIGRKIKAYCEPFGTFEFYYDPVQFRTHKEHRLAGVFSVCQIVVICCALTPETTGMVGYDLLKLLPRDAVLVNTARGEVIDEDALARVMRERPDLRVCLDVVCGEVNGTAQPERLRQLGAYITPHIAGETFESRTKAARIILGLLKKEPALGTPLGMASPAVEDLAHVY